MRRRDDTHECPVSACRTQVPDHMLMCRKHWQAVPRDVQRTVYRAWASGEGAGTEEHQAACREAIHLVEVD